MKQINHNQLKSLIETHYNKKIPFMCFGGIGIGKSDTIRKIAKELAEKKNEKFIEWNKISDKEKENLIGNTKDKFLLVDIRASQLDPSDLRGLPSFKNDTKDFVEWKPNLVFRILSEKDCDGILFFDEINLSAPIVMSSLYQIFLDRAIGEISLSENIGIFGCGNRLSDRANVFDIPAPLKDRMSEAELLIPSKDDWVEWAFDNGIDHKIISFINFKPSRLYCFDTKSADKSSTPRGWARTSNLIKDLKKLDDIELLTASSVGEATAIEFSAFLKLGIKIDVKEILNHPEKIKKLGEEIGIKEDETLSLKYSLLSTISEYYKTNKEVKVLEKIFNVCNYLETEFSVLLLRMIKSIDETFFKKEAIKLKNSSEILKGYAKYLL